MTSNKNNCMYESEKTRKFWEKSYSLNVPHCDIHTLIIWLDLHPWSFNTKLKMDLKKIFFPFSTDVFMYINTPSTFGTKLKHEDRWGAFLKKFIWMIIMMLVVKRIWLRSNFAFFFPSRCCVSKIGKMWWIDTSTICTVQV